MVQNLRNSSWRRVFTVRVPHEKSAFIDAELRRKLPEDENFDVEEQAPQLVAVSTPILKRALGPEVLSQLAAFGEGSAAKAVLIQGLPVPEPMPDTPTGGWCTMGPIMPSTAIQLGLMNLMGIQPIAFLSENGGHLIRNVVANPDEVDSLSSHGSRREFPWHVDNPNRRFMIHAGPDSPIPMVLTFTGVRPNDGNGQPVPTEVMLLETLLDALDEETKAALELPEFRVGAPDSNASLDGTPAALENTPLLVRHVTHGSHFRYDRNVTEGLTARAINAIARVDDCLLELEGKQLSVDLSAGTFFAFINTQVLHRRKGYVPGNPATSRWLRRCYGCRRLEDGVFVHRELWPYLWH